MLEIKYRLDNNDKNEYINMVRNCLPRNIDGIYNALHKDNYNKNKKRCLAFNKKYNEYKNHNKGPYMVLYYSGEIKKLLNELKLDKKYKDMDFDKWICLEYEKIKEIKKQIDDLIEKDRANYEKICKNFNMFKEYYEKFSSDRKDGKINEFIVRVTNCKVCPYCNINYTYTRDNEIAVSPKRNGIISKIKKIAKNDTKSLSKEDIKPKVTAQLDHFFPKDTYPMFALCFYNLIPSCSSCNNVKSDRFSKNMISPYDSEFFSKSNPVFTYTGDINSLKIDINKELLVNSEVFLLEDAYKNHVNEMKDIIRTAEIYCDENFQKGYKKLIEDINIRDKLLDQDFCNFVFKTVINENDDDKFCTRSLSKCKSDIFNQAVAEKQNFKDLQEFFESLKKSDGDKT